MKNILITDSLFFFSEHEKQLRDAGYSVTRLDKPNATEDELCEAVKGKVGYLLGGVEKVTERVIDSADQLKAISVTGIGYPVFIPAWKYALKKGIAISNTPSGPTQEVAEWAMTAALMMNRDFLELGRVGKKTFKVTKGIENQKVGIIGLGRIGTRIAEMLVPFKPAAVTYCGQHRHVDQEQKLGLKYLGLNELLRESDIVFLCVADEAQGLIGSNELGIMKPDALLVNFTHPGIIDEHALLDVLKLGTIRAISDYPMLSEFAELPLGRWYCMNNTNTITEAGAKLMSDTATTSLLNLLATGEDQYKIA
jgi:D-3-phosphoglycerate dehydrogenase